MGTARVSGELMMAAMSWFHFGLRGRLFMAFGLVAALTVMASSNAIFSYVSLGVRSA